MAAKANRLSKVARELNVGITTIVDFLADQGHEIETSPNTKIDEEIYQVLLEEFQADQSAKEKSKMTSVGKETREAISLHDTEQPEKKNEEEGTSDEVIIKNISSSAAPTPTPTALPTPIPVATPEVIKTEKKGINVSVVGKIDLDKDKKKEEPKLEEKKAIEEKPKEDKPVAEKPKAEEPKREESKTEKSQTEKPKEEKPKKEEVTTDDAPTKENAPKVVETIKARPNKLTGPTVVGKIELPVEKQKVASSKGSDYADDKKKRKRKRIKKVDIEQTAKGKGGNNQNSNKKKPNKSRKTEVTEADIQKEIKETLARLSGGGKSQSSKNRRAKRDERSQKREEEMIQQELEKSVLKLTEFVSVSELATMMNVSSTDVIGACMSLGIFASINQRLDAETISIISEEFGYTVEFVSADVQESIEEVLDKPEDLKPRSPIVTVMGHVDHGKTSLLDYVRKANVIAGEAGGITQHIGAYNVEVSSGKSITFLDTPGHEAFTAMRARGAQVTDVAIIVIAADDNVMPQTKEAINHAQAAGVPMVFALNKVDRPEASPDKIREELSVMNILVEDWGGKFQCQEISAKTGKGVAELLEKVSLEAELLELKANPNKNAIGTVIESTLDKGRGFVTTILVEAGTLKIGDVILAGCYSGKVKAMHNERGNPVEGVGPSGPVSILGLNGAPNAGDKFNIMNDEREAKQIATKRLQLQREQGIRTQKHITLDEIGRRLAVGDFQELNVIVKGDVDGSIEALSDSLLKLSTEQIQVNIIHKAVGQITESDVLLASASDAIVVGFQVRPSPSARKLAESEKIDIRLYSIIYKAIEEIKSAMEGMLSPDIEEKILGTAEVREVYKISKVGTIAGCFVLDGKIIRNNKIRVIRDGIVIYTGELSSLKRFKDDVKEVANNYECGMSVERFNDLKVGDNIESYEEVEVAKKL